MWIYPWRLYVRRPLDGPEPIPWSQLREQWVFSSDGQMPVGPLLVALGGLLLLILLIWTGIPGRIWRGMIRVTKNLFGAGKSSVNQSIKMNRRKTDQKPHEPDQEKRQGTVFFDAKDGPRFKVRIRVKDIPGLDEKFATFMTGPMHDLLEILSYFAPPENDPSCAEIGMQLRMDIEETGQRRVTSLVWTQPDEPQARSCAQETHLTLGDDASAARLLEGLGFRPIRRFEVRRRQRVWNHCTVSLDKLPYLGGFVEISGSTERQVLFVRRELGLDSFKQFLLTYPKMLDPYLQKIQCNEAYIPLPPGDERHLAESHA